MHAASSSTRHLARQVLLVAAAACALPVAAQSGQGSGNPSTAAWWRPGMGQTSLGLNLGQSRYHTPCGAGFGCDNKDAYVSLYGRNMVNDQWGSELAFVHMGKVERAGGDSRAYGLNLSLVGKVPLTQSLGAFGKVGALYGHTNTQTNPASGLAGGTENGFGLSLGIGASWDFTPKLSAVLEWDRYTFKFAGTGRDPVRATSIGLQYRY